MSRCSRRRANKQRAKRCRPLNFGQRGKMRSDRRQRYNLLITVIHELMFADV